MKSNQLTLAQDYLLKQLGINISGADAQSKLSDGNLYILKEITGTGGMIDLIDSSTLEKIGTSSFNGQRLPTGTKMAIEGIRLGLAVVGAEDTNPPAAQFYTNKASATEAKFRAAHFIIARSGKKVFDKSVREMLTLDSVQGMCGENDVYYLKASRMLQGDEPLNIQLSFPDNVQWTPNKKVFVSVEILGPSALV